MSRITKFSVLKEQIEQGLEVQTARFEATQNPYYQGQMTALQALKKFCNDLTLKSGKTISPDKK